MSTLTTETLDWHAIAAAKRLEASIEGLDNPDLKTLRLDLIKLEAAIENQSNLTSTSRRESESRVYDIRLPAARALLEKILELSHSPIHYRNELDHVHKWRLGAKHTRDQLRMTVERLRAEVDQAMDMRHDFRDDLSLATTAEAKTRDTERQKSLDWLSGVECELKQVDLSQKRMPGSGDWLLRSSMWHDFVSESSLQEYHNLWLSGVPGSGKTMLMSRIVEKLQEDNQDTKNHVVAFYYFDDRNRTSVYNAVASLLRQLCYHQDMLPPSMEMKWAQWRRDSLASTKNKMTLLEVVNDFFTLLSSFPRIYICIDGLDECEDLPFMTQILQRISSIPCKTCVTSRNSVESVRGLTRNINVEEYNLGDIESYVKYYCQQHDELQKIIDSSTMARAAKKLSNNSHRSFLTVILQMQELCRQTSAHEFQTRLEKMPYNLEQTYQMVLSRVEEQSESRKNLAKCVLTWIAHAYRPLTFSELQQAVSIVPWAPNSWEGNIEAATDEERLLPPGMIADVCMDLITIDVGRNTAVFTQASLTYYIQAFRNTLFPQGEEYISSCLISILQHSAFSRPTMDHTEHRSLVNILPFSMYASQHWGDHLRDHWRDWVIVKFKQILNDDSESLTQLLHLFQRPDDHDLLDYPRSFGAAHFAAYFNLDFSQLKFSGSDIRALDSWGRSALHIACQQGKQDAVRNAHFQELRIGTENRGAEVSEQTTDMMVETDHESQESSSLILSKRRRETFTFLLAEGNDVNQKDKYSKTPLHYAAIHGKYELAKVLIENGADVLAIDNASWSPLAYAAANGHLDLTKFLLKKGADDAKALWVAASVGHTRIVRLLGGFGNGQGKARAIFEAAKNGFFNIVGKLQDLGAELSFRDENGMTALHYAVKARSSEVASFLIIGGADINMLDIRKRSLLQHAAESGDDLIVHLLVGRGARTEAQDINGRTALDQAVEMGRSDIVRYLVRHGSRRTLSSDLESNESQKVKSANGRGPVRMTPLQVACRSGSEDVVHALLEAAHPDDNGHTQRTPLSYAAENGHSSIVKLLLSTRRVNLNAQDQEGCTPLLYAARMGRAEVVSLLVKEETLQANHMDKSGKTALFYAEKQGHTEVKALLLGKLSSSAPSVHSLWSDAKRTTKRARESFVAGNSRLFPAKLENVKLGQNLPRDTFEDQVIEPGVFIVAECLRLGSDVLDACFIHESRFRQLDKSVLLLKRLWSAVQFRLEIIQTILDSTVHKVGRILGALLYPLATLLFSGKNEIIGLVQKNSFSSSVFNKKARQTEPFPTNLIITEIIDSIRYGLEKWQQRFEPLWFLFIKGVGPWQYQLLQQSLESRPFKLDEKFILTHADRFRKSLQNNTHWKKPEILDFRDEIGDLEYHDIFGSEARVAIQREPGVGYLDKIYHTLNPPEQSRRFIVDVFCQEQAGASHVLDKSRLSLAFKLEGIDPEVFGILSCKGFILSRDRQGPYGSAVELVFDIPERRKGVKSLRAILSEKMARQSLQQRIDIAKGLAKSVSFAFSLNLVHRNIRPESILIIESLNEEAPPLTVLGGFGSPSALHEENTDVEGGDTSWQNIYHHPSTNARSKSKKYTPQHDIYSLGVCLLEIALGESFVQHSSTKKPALTVGSSYQRYFGESDQNTSFDTDGTDDSMLLLKPGAWKAYLSKLARTQLPQYVGARYSEVVLRCLSSLDEESDDFPLDTDQADPEGIELGIRYIEKVLNPLNEINL